MEVSSIPVLLITANVGSVFEDPSRLLNSWIKEFLNKIALVKPHFLALHLQEVGGKTYEKSMEYVQEFIRILCESEELADYNRIRVYLDEDFNSAEHFTALGNLYFVHHSLQTVKIWNFYTHEWETADGKNIYTGNIEAIPSKEKAKFPQHFFPECKWSRKGFLRTRWELNCTVIDLVNIHLFHDASNLVACEEFPSVYCKTRRRALVHTLERFHSDSKNGIAPYYVFGDFNFRCDTKGAVRKLTEDLTKHRVQNIKNDNTKMHYKNTEGENVLTVGKKEFNHSEHQTKFKESWLQKFDRELEPLREILVEYPITFAPTYPYEEDPEMPKSYMSTRCPAWCDRILMNPTARELIVDETFSSSDYNVIGENICMGDHKPIYLSVHLKTLQGTKLYCKCHQQLSIKEHEHNFYNNFNSFLLNYEKILKTTTSQLAKIEDNFDINFDLLKDMLPPTLYKYCLYLNRNFVVNLIECRNLDIKNAKKLNACIESAKQFCKNESSPGNNNNICNLSNINNNENMNITNKLLKCMNSRNANNQNYTTTTKRNSNVSDNSETVQKDAQTILKLNDDPSQQQQINEEDDEEKTDSQMRRPRISINITNHDEGTVDDICMCSQYITQSADSYQFETDSNTQYSNREGFENHNQVPQICSQCQNIIKVQSHEPRLRLISKRLMLANNIIVNRIDTQLLHTRHLTQNSQFESYTPESAESHSPCPEYSEYLMDDEIDSVINIVNDDNDDNDVNNFPGNDLTNNSNSQNNSQTNMSAPNNYISTSNNTTEKMGCEKKKDEGIDHKQLLIDAENLIDEIAKNCKKQQAMKNSNTTSETLTGTAVPTKLSSDQSASSEKRGIVSPIQLKSRLEILQRKSLETGEDIDNSNGLLNANKKFDDSKDKTCYEKCCSII